MKKIFPGWWQVVVTFIVQAISAASIFTSYSIVAVQYQEAFQPTRMVLMLGVTGTLLLTGFLSPVLGAVMDRFSIRKLMLAGSISLSAGFLLISFANSMIQVIMIYAIFMSLGIVVLGPLAASALLARWFERRRGFVMGVAASGTAVGGLLIPPLLQGMIDGLEWRLALQVFSGAIFLTTAPLVAFVVIDRPSDRNLQIDGVSQPVDVSRSHLRTFKPLSTSALFRSVEFWMVSLMLSLIFSGTMGVTSNLLPFVIGHNVDPVKGALLLSINAAAGFTGKLLCAFFVDRFDGRVVFAAILIVLLVAIFSFLQADAYPMFVIASFLMGIAGGAATPLWSVLVARIYGPENVGRAMGMMNFLITPGTLICPPLFGWVFDQTGNYDYAFIGYIVLLIIAMLLLPKVHGVKPEIEHRKAV